MSVFQKSVLSLSSFVAQFPLALEAAEHIRIGQMWDDRNEKRTLPCTRLTSLKPKRSTVPLKVKNTPRQR